MLRHVVDLLARLDRGRYQPVVMAGEGEPVTDAAKKLGIPVIPAEFGPSLRPASEIGNVRRIRRAIRQTGASLVHVHGFRVSVPGRMAARLTGVPAVYTVHNSLLTAAAQSGAKKRIYAALERGLTSSTELYVAVSRAIERELTSALGVPTARIATIMNGIDPGPFVEAADRRRQAPAPATAPPSAREQGQEGNGGPGRQVSGITVSRLIPSKGIADLLEALALLAARGLDVHWRAVGDGPQRQELEERARTLGIAGRVHFTGFRPPEELPAFLAEADLFALPSHSEAAGIAALEAMASGLPVVAARSGGVPELVVDGETGLLVEPAHPEELAAAIERLCAEPAAAAAMGRKGRERVISHFSVEETARRTQAAYDAVLEGQKNLRTTRRTE